MTDELEPLFEGYDLSQIEDVANDLFELLADQGIPIQLGILGLCRAITIFGEKDDLDMACKMIDTFSEIPFDEEVDEEDLEGEI